MTELKSALLPTLTVANSTQDSSKKQVLEQISRLVHSVHPDVKYQTILEALQQRERLGSTSVGHGVALPHARIPNLNSPLCTLMTLRNAISFQADDAVAVDIVFGLVVPEEATDEHLALLSELAEKCRDKKYREALRKATTNETLYQAAIDKPEA